MKKSAVVALGIALLLEILPVAYATEDGQSATQLEGLDIVWVDTENTLSVLGRDKLVTEYKILGHGGMMGHNTWGDYGLRNADGELLLSVQYGTTLPGGVKGNHHFAVSAVDGVYTDYLGGTFTDADCTHTWSPPELDVGRVPGEDGRLESGKWFYADPWTGEVVLPAIYDEAYSFSDGLGIVRVGEERYAIDRTGTRVIDLTGYRATDSRFVNGYLRVQSKETARWGFLNTKGELVSDCQWENSRTFTEEGLAGVQQNGKCGLLDTSGNLVVPCVLDEMPTGEDGLAIVVYQGKQGILKLPTWTNTASAWSTGELSEAKQAGFVTPECEKYPQFPITRRQFASLVVNWLEKTTGEEIIPAKENTFADTDETAVLKAYAAGIVQGTGNGNFCLGGLLTREQMAVMLWRAMEKAGISKDFPYADLNEYVDGEQVSDWARAGLSALSAMEIFRGSGENRLDPHGTCTVEQSILLVWRAAG